MPYGLIRIYYILNSEGFQHTIEFASQNEYNVHESNEQRQNRGGQIACLQADLTYAVLIGRTPVNEEAEGLRVSAAGKARAFVRITPPGGVDLAGERPSFRTNYPVQWGWGKKQSAEGVTRCRHWKN